jgi:hypothetical protein
MAKIKQFFPVLLSGAVLLAMGNPAFAQLDAKSNTIAAPDYGSGASAGSLSNGNFNTPESDGRPAVYFFTLGVQAFKKGDYRHAIDMYKVAASWAYKPAEYNLGLMYFKGEGVHGNRARGAAWMVLAAERGQPLYVKARDLMITALTDAQFKRTDAIWNQLKPTYGDAVALRRAKAQWAWVRDHKTGTRVGGGVGELSVGVLDTGHSPKPPTSMAVSGAQLMQGGSIDGSIAYQQFDQSNNPYDPRFESNREGTVTVEPLQSVKSKCQ